MGPLTAHQVTVSIIILSISSIVGMTAVAVAAELCIAAIAAVVGNGRKDGVHLGCTAVSLFGLLLVEDDLYKAGLGWTARHLLAALLIARRDSRVQLEQPPWTNRPGPSRAQGAY